MNHPIPFHLYSILKHFVFLNRLSNVPAFPTPMPSYYPVPVVCYVPSNVTAEPSRKRPSADFIPNTSIKRVKNAENPSTPLRVFMSYLRQQYAFCPRWWLLFRLVMNNLCSRSSENKQKYIDACLLLLSGKKKERKLLASYLDISFDPEKSKKLDRCFTGTRLAITIPFILNACEEVLCFGQLIDPWTVQIDMSNSWYIYSRRKEEEVEDKALFDKVTIFQKQNYERFEAFMNVLEIGSEMQKRVVEILQNVREKVLSDFLGIGNVSQGGICRFQCNL